MTKNNKEYMNKYYHEHKDKWGKPKEQFCDLCGVTIKHGRLWKHKQSNKHISLQNYIDLKKQLE